MSSEPPFGQLFKTLSADLGSLASHTAALARLEFTTALSTIYWSVAGVLAGAVLALAGLGVLAGALVLIAIALGLPPWAAALGVGVGLTAGGAGTVIHFVNNLRTAQLTLKGTRDSLKETMAWLKKEAIS